VATENSIQGFPTYCKHYILIAWRGGLNFLVLNLADFKGVRAG